jgi:tRNA A-37 threonylcarbamoyl transferase component Bud32
VGVRVLLDPSLAPALAAAGWASADALFRLGGDPEAASCVAAVDAPIEGTVGRFHVKRYRYAGWGESKGLLGRGTLWGRAPEVAEFKALQWLREHGIPAVRPVAAASRSRRGRLVAHALVTEHVPGAVDLATRLRTPGDPVLVDRAVRARLALLLGRTIHRMHSEGFVHRDAFARNVLVRVEDGEPRIWLLDCRRGGPPSWRHGPFVDLAALDSGLRGSLPRADRLRALCAYLDAAEDPGYAVKKIARLRERVERR